MAAYETKDNNIDIDRCYDAGFGELKSALLL